MRKNDLAESESHPYEKYLSISLSRSLGSDIQHFSANWNLNWNWPVK